MSCGFFAYSVDHGARIVKIFSFLVDNQARVCYRPIVKFIHVLLYNRRQHYEIFHKRPLLLRDRRGAHRRVRMPAIAEYEALKFGVFVHFNMQQFVYTKDEFTQVNILIWHYLTQYPIQ